jgi:hypothetical protein
MVSFTTIPQNCADISNFVGGLKLPLTAAAAFTTATVAAIALTVFAKIAISATAIYALGSFASASLLRAVYVAATMPSKAEVAEQTFFVTPKKDVVSRRLFNDGPSGVNAASTLPTKPATTPPKTGNFVVGDDSPINDWV